MRPFCIFVGLILLCSQSVTSYQAGARLSRYVFPGPRSDYHKSDRSDYESSSFPVRVKRKPQYDDIIDSYDKYSVNNKPTTSDRGSAQTYRPSISDPYSGRTYGPSSSSSSDYSSRPYSGGSSSSSDRSNYDADSYRAARPNKESSKEQGGYKEDSEEEKKPGRLEILLGESKFTCQGKKDGYYADNSVACQVFHYCVAGAKHSWMCPEGTVFHQVHLNCVPANQDICSQSEKFYVVNDYLHKPIDNHGPNNSIRYHQRYYPEEFLGDPLTAGFQSVQSFPPRSNSAPTREPVNNYNSNEEDDPSAYDRPYVPANVRNSRPESYPSSYPPPSRPTSAPHIRPYTGNGYLPGPPSNSNTRSSSNSYTSSNGDSYSSYSRPSPSPYSAAVAVGGGGGGGGGSGPSSGRSQYAPAAYQPSSGYSAPAPVSRYSVPSSNPVNNYSPYKPSSNPSSSYDYSRTSSSYSPNINPKPANTPYNSPPYSPYSGPSSASARSSSSGSSSNYPARSSYTSNSRPYTYSGVHYEEDY